LQRCASTIITRDPDDIPRKLARTMDTQVQTVNQRATEKQSLLEQEPHEVQMRPITPTPFRELILAVPATRAHFSVNEKVLEILRTQQDSQKRQYAEFVYDTNDLSLLKNGFWLLLRQDEKGAHFWRLRVVQRSAEAQEYDWVEVCHFLRAI
jgi:hypothetical protein